MLPFELLARTGRRVGTVSPSELARWLVEHGFATLTDGRLTVTALGHAAGSGLG